MLASFFFALELVISRLILDYYSPMSFYFLRCITILIIAFVIFRPKYRSFNKEAKFEILLVGIVWTIYRVVVYYGYLELGVIFTTLVIMLGPILIYFFAWKFLKEKVSWRNIVASIIILGCILYALLA